MEPVSRIASRSAILPGPMRSPLGRSRRMLRRVSDMMDDDPSPILLHHSAMLKDLTARSHKIRGPNSARRRPDQAGDAAHRSHHRGDRPGGLAEKEADRR